MKKTILAAVIGVSISGAAQADMLGFYVGAGIFNTEFSGDFQDEDASSFNVSVDLEDDLDIKDDTGKYVYIAFEHPVPIIPNIRLARTELEQTGTSAISKTFEFDGITFTENAVVDSTIDLSHTDGTLYYEILDNWVNLDLGITVRQFDGQIKLEAVIDGQLRTAEEDLDYPIPMLYGKAQFDLPFSGLSASVEGNWIGYSGNSFMDAVAKIGYEGSLGLGVEAGLRTISVELDDQDDLSASLDLSGPYIAATFHF